MNIKIILKLKLIYDIIKIKLRGEVNRDGQGNDCT